MSDDILGKLCFEVFKGEAGQQLLNYLNQAFVQLPFATLEGDPFQNGWNGEKVKWQAAERHAYQRLIMAYFSYQEKLKMSSNQEGDENE